MAVLRLPIEQQDAQLRIWRDPETAWLRVSGEIDAWSVEGVKDALRAAHREPGDIQLDVSRLLFCDVTGIRAIVAAAAQLEDGRRLVLRGLSPQLQKVFGVVGWGGMPGLVYEAGGVDWS